MISSNKQLVLDFYAKVYGQGDFSYADSVIHENYIQHNPLVKTGKYGFMEFLNMLSQMPKPEKPQKPFMRIVSEDNFVVVHSKVNFMAKDHATVDLIRIENGMFVEHWDASQTISSGLPVVVGEDLIDKEEVAERNKGIVNDFIQNIIIKKNYSLASKYLIPEVSLGNFELGFDSFQLHRLIGEHNYVVTQAGYLMDSKRYVVYDIFRLKEGFIREHWNVKQAVPEIQVHNNGMI